MPVTPTYPGVYIEELPSGVRAITGVSTSIAAFIGYFKKGPMDKAVQIFSMGDFEREFGGLESKSEASYAVKQFFINGGKEAWVVRTAGGSHAKATLNILDGINGADALTVTAISEGLWGNSLRVVIDHYTSEPGNLFNLTVLEYASSNGSLQIAKTEVFKNLSMSGAHDRYVEAVINDESSGSKLIRVSVSGSNMPAQTGTLSGDLSTFPTLTDDTPEVRAKIGDDGPYTATFGSKPTTLKEARSVLEAAIRASKPDNPAFASAAVRIFDGKHLHVLAGPTSSESTVTFSGEPDPVLIQLGLDSATNATGMLSGNLSAYGGISPDPGKIKITIGGTEKEITLDLGGSSSLADARNELETQIQAADTHPKFANAQVFIVKDSSGDPYLMFLSGSPWQTISFAAGSTDNVLDDLALDTALSVTYGKHSGDLTGFIGLEESPANFQIKIGIDTEFRDVTISGNPTTLETLRSELETGIRAAHSGASYDDATVAIIKDANDKGHLLILPGIKEEAITFKDVLTKTLTELKLDTTILTGDADANVQEYTLGKGKVTDTAQGNPGPNYSGDDGSPPDGVALMGAENDKTGIYALEDVDLFNILCIPRAAMVEGSDKLDKAEAKAVIAVAIGYCEKRRAFFIMDAPNDVNDVQGIKGWLDDNATLRHKNAAFYFPRVKIADPLNEYRLRSFGASGTIAGLYARTDSTRGVWKAPAGTEAALSNVQALDYVLTDKQNGTLNPVAINCLRNFKIYGNVCWGSRTLDGADQMASEWKYIPVRRLALFIEESLFRGTKWVVFEPNDEPLWAQIRLNLGAFMHRLFRQGAFEGTSPKEAYFVKCDKETTTPTDQNLGIVNIVVGFAPLKPAEFVIIKIQQIAKQV